MPHGTDQDFLGASVEITAAAALMASRRLKNRAVNSCQQIDSENPSIHLGTQSFTRMGQSYSANSLIWTAAWKRSNATTKAGNKPIDRHNKKHADR